MSAKRLINIILHVLSTGLIIITATVLMPMKENSATPSFLNYHRIIFTLAQVAGFYAIAYFFYPRLILKRKIPAYILAVIGIAVFIALLPLNFHADRPGATSWGLAGIMVKFMIGLFVMGTATSYRFIMDAMRQQMILQENLQIELSFLRSQISPHFMFNSLNSMVALARQKSENLEPALLKMSSLMHYMLYDSDEEKVTVRSELDYLQSYLDLQTMRFGDSVKIIFMANQQDDSQEIEPMLLIPLIENAFKHGTTTIDQPEISIALKSSRSEIMLQVSNKASLLSASSDDSKGIGLQNLRRRLALLYPGRHHLAVNKAGDIFHAKLEIQFAHA